MTKKLEAAYHEAGHVVVAWPNVVSGIDLAQYGAGAADDSAEAVRSFLMCQRRSKIRPMGGVKPSHGLRV